MEPILCTTLESPVGLLRVARSAEGLVAIQFGAAERPVPPHWQEVEGPEDEAVAQLRAYFAGELRRFDLPLAPSGTPFQRAVWAALCEIPYGTTVSYGALAQRLGRPGAVRAVGAANGRNPLPIVIPCHRVVAGDGTIGGYSGGFAVKRALLALEGVHFPDPERQLGLF